LILQIGPDYPLTPPSVVFKTRIFHPNVDFKTGEVCLDVLKSDWSPAWGIATVCRAIVALLDSPNPDSPLNCDAGNMLRNNDIIGFNSLARMYTQEYAA
jgi:peroxin-4